jgi:hypothetical protein
MGAVEEVGEDNVNSLVVTWGLMLTLKGIHGAELGEIEDKVREIPSALRYIKESKIDYGLPGQTGGTVGTIVAANLYGKDEDNTFGFTQSDVDGFLAIDAELMRPKTYGLFFALVSNIGRGMLSLCISDFAKKMLLNNSGFIPHLVSGLLLDPDHPRKDTPQATKAIVQRDFAECIQQLSLFPPGCEALQAAPGVHEALEALIDTGWTEEAKDCARGALMQLTGQHPEVIASRHDALHIMVSCESAHTPHLTSCV